MWALAPGWAHVVHCAVYRAVMIYDGDKINVGRCTYFTLCAHALTQRCSSFARSFARSRVRSRVRRGACTFFCCSPPLTWFAFGVVALSCAILLRRVFLPVSRACGHVLSWVQKMAGGSKSERLEVVGDEWSTRDDVLRVIHDFILVRLTTAPRRHERCFVRAAQKVCTLPLTVSSSSSC